MRKNIAMPKIDLYRCYKLIPNHIIIMSRANETAKKIGLLLLLGVLNGIGYKAAQIIKPTGILVTTWLDSLIPYIAVFVIPYALYVPVVLLPFALYWKDYNQYRTMALSMIAVLAISVAIFMTFQTYVIRTNVEPTDFFNWGVVFVQSLDAPVNALPSLHVAMPTLATLFIYLRNRRLAMIVAPVTVLIILSTMFIKQHAVLDVIAGLILAFAVFKYRHVFEKKKK